MKNPAACSWKATNYFSKNYSFHPVKNFQSGQLKKSDKSENQLQHLLHTIKEKKGEKETKPLPDTVQNSVNLLWKWLRKP